MEMNHSDSGTRARLAAELTELRTQVGKPSFRLMASMLEKVHPNTVRETTLRDAATADAPVPKPATVFQFVTACRIFAEQHHRSMDPACLDLDVWYARWKRIGAADDADAQEQLTSLKVVTDERHWADEPIAVMVGPIPREPDHCTQTDPAPGLLPQEIPQHPKNRHRRPPWAWSVIGLVTCLVIAGAVGVGVRVLGQSAEVPFTWTASWDEKLGFAFMFHQSPDELGAPPPTDSTARLQWARDRQAVQSLTVSEHGYKGALGRIKAVLRARSADMPVTLLGLFVEVVDRSSPIVGTQVAVPTGLPASGRFVQFNVDGDPPRMVDSSRDAGWIGDEDPAVGGSGLRQEPMRFPYQISTTDTELFVISVITNHHVKWRIKVEWSTGTTSGTAVIDDNGRPFEVSPAGSGSHFCWPIMGTWKAGLTLAGQYGEC